MELRNRLILGIFLFIFIACETSDKNTEAPISFGIEEIELDTTIADILKAFTYVEDDSLFIEVHFKEIPDSILFNDSKISLGYYQYALFIIYRNSDLLKDEYLTFDISWNNIFNNMYNEQLISSQEFFNRCEKKSHIFNKKEKEESPHLLISQNFNILVDSNVITISQPFSSYEKYKQDFFSENRFALYSTYNKPDSAGVNNFFVDFMSNIKDLRYNFYPPYSRILETGIKPASKN